MHNLFLLHRKRMRRILDTTNNDYSSPTGTDNKNAFHFYSTWCVSTRMRAINPSIQGQADIHGQSSASFVIGQRAVTGRVDNEKSLERRCPDWTATADHLEVGQKLVQINYLSLLFTVMWNSHKTPIEKCFIPGDNRGKTRFFLAVVVVFFIINEAVRWSGGSGIPEQTHCFSCGILQRVYCG